MKPLLCACSVIYFWLSLKLVPSDAHANPKRWSEYKHGDVIIGALLPIHEQGTDRACGEMHEFGLGFAETLIYTIAQINNRSELLPGVTLGYDIRDYCESPTLAMKWTHEFVKNNYKIGFTHDTCGNTSRGLVPGIGNSSSRAAMSPVVAVIGAYDSGTTVLIAELLQVVEIPLISPFSTSEQLSNPFYTAFFRTIPPDGQQAKAIADIIDRFNWSYVAPVAVDHSYGRYGVGALEREAQQRKTFCVRSAAYFPRSGFQSKMEIIVENLKKKPLIKVILLWADREHSLAFLAEAMKQELYGKVWLVSGDLIFKNVFTTDIHGSFLGVAHQNHQNPDLEAYLERLPSGGVRHEWWKEFSEKEFNCSWSQQDGSKGPPCQNQSLKFSKSTLSNFYNAFSPYMIDAAYAIAYGLQGLYACNSTVHSCPKTKPYVNSADLVPYIQNVSMDGVTGKFRFDAQGNPTSSAYDIINLHKDPSGAYRKIIIGTWSEQGGLSINASKIEWLNGEVGPPLSYCSEKCPPGSWQTKMRNCCWECILCPNGTVSSGYSVPTCDNCTGNKVPNIERTVCITEMLVASQLSTAVGVIITVLAAFGMVVSCVASVLLIRFYNTPLIKASNRELSFALLAAIAFSFVMSIIHIVTPTDPICKLTQAWRYPIHSACVSMLFIKTVRLAGAFQLQMKGLPRCCKRFFIDPRLQVLVLVLLTACPILLVTLWRSIDPPYVIKETRTLRTEIKVEYSCNPYSGINGHSLELSSLSYLIVLTLMCIYYAFKARNLPANFNETKHIGFSLYILLLSWLTYYPINSALNGWYVAIISSLTALLGSYGMLGCIFGPKMYIIIFQPAMNTNEFVRAELRSANRSINSVSAQSN